MTVRWRLGAARTGIGLLAVATLVHVAVLVPRIAPLARTLPARVEPAVWAVVLTVVTAVAACVLAVILLWRAGSRPGVPVLAAFLCFLAAFWGSLLRFLSISVETDSVSATLEFGGLPGFLATTALLAAVTSFVHLSTTFPRRLTAADLVAGGRLSWLRRLRVALLRPRVLWTWFVVLLAVQTLPSRLMGVLGLAGETGAADTLSRTVLVNIVLGVAILGVLPLLGIALGARNLMAGYRGAAPGERRPVLWLTVGYTTASWMVLAPVVMLLLVALVGVHTPDALAVVWAVLVVAAPTVVVATTAIAVFFAGAFDPALILRRSTIWGFAGAIGLLMFAGLENALSNWVESRLALPGAVGAIAAGAVAAGVMVPVRALLSSIAGRVVRNDGGR